MKYFEASFAQVVIRFYLMIAIALIAGFANIPWLGLLCVPIFLSAMMGIKFDPGAKNKNTASPKILTSKPVMSPVKDAA